ncbi:MAG: rod shape-determining protein MreC [Candidatus Omnitrophica bacterium]|nr:rod shape-determining protein MreC [Candidatus Omnitrophota bacterium]
MLWRFRREIIFVLGIAVSLLVINRSYVRERRAIENGPYPEVKKISYEELAAENRRLREILDIKAENPSLRKFTVSEVISIKPFVFPAEIIVNKGEREGLKENMAVVSKDLFLIGRIGRVWSTASSVITIFNAKSKISVIVDSTRETGVLEGGSIPFLSLRYIPADSPVKKGDKILTSGYSDFYPKGIEVGEVASIEKVSDTLFLKIHIKPYGYFSGIDEVLTGE